MAMVVKNNMSAVSTLNTLNKNSSALQKSLSKVSSGMKINSAQDDASGYAISERMRVQIRSLDQANQNTQNGSSMMKTAEGAVSSTVEILKSLKEKAINAANDTNKDSDRTTIQKEIDQFIDQIDDNALTTFNGKYLVDGSKAQEGGATYTAMTNQSLSTGTAGDTKLTALANRNNESLEITSTDSVTASFVMNGNTYTTKFDVTSDTELKDIFDNLNTAYQAETGSTDVVFGAANTATTTAASTYTDTATAVADITTDTTKLLATLKGTTGSDTKTANAIAYLVGEGKTADEINTAVNGKTSATAETNLGTKINQNLAAVTSTVEANGGDVADAATGNVLYFNDGAGTELGTNATNSQKIETGDTRTFTTVTDSSDSATMITAIKADADALIAGTAGASASVEAAVVKETTLTAGKLTVNGGTEYTGSNAVKSITTNATVAASDSTATDFAKTYLVDKLVAAASGGGSAEVLASTDIGKNAVGDMVTTADGTKGLTVTAAGKGVAGQIAGLTISVTDSEGNVKKAANASLDDFNTTIYAKNPSSPNELTFQVGAAANQAITVGLEDMRSEALGLKGSDGSKVSVATQDKANAAVNVFDNAIQKALDQQTTIGAIEARLEYTSQNLTTSSENVQAAESTIRDADMAKEMTNYTKNNVLLQAAQSMLAQANQSSSAVLSLLQ